MSSHVDYFFAWLFICLNNNLKIIDKKDTSLKYIFYLWTIK